MTDSKRHIETHTNLRHVGKIKKAQGLRGQVYCIIYSGDLSWFDQVKSFYSYDQDRNQIDLKVKKSKIYKDGLILDLEGVTNRNQSEALVGYEIWLPEDFFNSKKGEKLFLAEIENFQVKDQSLGFIGVVHSFSTNGLQDLLVIQKNDDQYEIPFVEAFVEHIDFEKKTLYMILPAGLLDINSSSEINDETNDEATDKAEQSKPQSSKILSGPINDRAKK